MKPSDWMFEIYSSIGSSSMGFGNGIEYSSNFRLAVL